MYALHYRYAIGPGMEELSSLFAVNPDSGWITLLTPLDREARSFYNLSVIVWDTPDRLGRKSDMSLTSTTSVLITVTDVNDNAPTFQVHNLNLFACLKFKLSLRNNHQLFFFCIGLRKHGNI